jgi:xanthosine phosphorylase
MNFDPQGAADAIRQASRETPRLGLVLGSGLGRIAERIVDPIVLPYAQLPGFTVPSVEGHAGRLVLGRLAGVPVACLQGRIHLYEGVDPRAIQVPIRALKLAGCEGVIVTNAAGSMRPAMAPGALMLIADHMNFQGTSPLVGANEARFGPRFFAMKDAYDPDWRQRFKAVAGRLGVALHEGVYTGYLGPNFETPAEIRAFATLGGDAVGMSTVPEVLVARHCGLRVAAICVITNMAAGMSDEDLTHAQTLAGAAAAAETLERLLLGFLEDVR